MSVATTNNEIGIKSKLKLYTIRLFTNYKTSM